MWSEIKIILTAGFGDVCGGKVKNVFTHARIRGFGDVCGGKVGRCFLKQSWDSV